MNTNKLEKKERNPDWTRDELILALDYYFDCEGRPQNEGVKALSKILNSMNTGSSKVNHKFRNINGVGLKLMNFRRLDPNFISAGKVGLKHGGKGDQDVWNYFVNSRELLKKTALAILSNINSPELNNYLNVDDSEVMESREGRILTRVHLYRERNSKKVKQVLIDKALKTSRGLVCEVCDFSFSKKYGVRGARFMEAHHIRPLSELSGETKVKPRDLVLLCANCHRMVHAKKPWLSIDELRKIINSIRKR